MDDVTATEVRTAWSRIMGRQLPRSIKIERAKVMLQNRCPNRFEFEVLRSRGHAFENGET